MLVAVSVEDKVELVDHMAVVLKLRFFAAQVDQVEHRRMRILLRVDPRVHCGASENSNVECSG